MTQIKTKLSDAYKIISYQNLDDHTYTHLSARSQEGDSFYIYPFGFRFAETNPEDLLKVGLDGKIQHGSEKNYNQTGYIIHSMIYNARDDINAIFHLHTPEIVAVSAKKQGLLPISQWALHFYNQIAYHDYHSLALYKERGNKLINDLGDKFVMLLRNHGSITCGRTIEEAMFYTHHLQLACKTQCLSSLVSEELVLPDEETCQQANKELLNFEENLGERDWKAWQRLLKRLNMKN